MSNLIKDKVVGSWYGMALGDAMGLSVKNMKQETIRQLFVSMDGFKDVRPFIGKGIKRFKMQGLYGEQTQSALVVADSLIKNKRAGTSEISKLLVKLSSNGPDHYFGVYRHPEKGFQESVGSMMDKLPRTIEHDRADATFLTMGIPASLLLRDRPETSINLNIDIGLLMSRNLCEISGLALTGYLAVKLLSLEPRYSDGALILAEQVLKDAEEYCQKIENQFQKTAPNLWNKIPESERGMLGETIKSLREQWDLSFEDLLNWICQNASDHHKKKITSPVHGYVLTLLPLCLLIVLREGRGFNASLTTGLNMGKETNKIGALIGTWAGAIYGWEEIPESWRSGLANGKEIRLRGEGLFFNRFPKEAKDIYEMELGLTTKEFEAGKKYFPKPSTKLTRPTPRPMLSWEDKDSNESITSEKYNVANWRKFQKDKSRMKKDRRKHLKKNSAGY